MASAKTRRIRKIHRKKKQKKKKTMTGKKIVLKKDPAPQLQAGSCASLTSNLAVRPGSGDQPQVAGEPDGGQQQPQDTVRAAPQTEEPDAGGARRRRVGDGEDCCSICGGRYHNEYFCAYNYMEGCLRVRTCREQCSPGQHADAAMAADERLRCFVRVSNVPSSLNDWGVGQLFRQFGPLRQCVVTKVGKQGGAGFGFVTFRDREHAEVAISKLNAHHVGDRKLRVDWAYPREHMY